MTISNTTDRTSVIGSATAGQVIPFTFPITNTSDIVVKTRVINSGIETTLTLTTDYSVTITGITGGSVTLVASCPATNQVHVLRSTPLTQTLNMTLGGAFNPELQEDAYDKATKQAIEGSVRLSRAIRQPDTDVTGVMTLPSSIDRASKYLAFDANGGVITSAGPRGDSAIPVSSFAETLLDDVSASSVLSTLGFSTFAKTLIDDTTAAATRTTLGAEKEFQINVQDYGAVGTDNFATDDTAAFTAAIAAGTNIYIPDGNYVITEVSIPTTANYTFTGTGTIKITGAKGFYRQAAETPLVTKKASFIGLNFIGVTNTYKCIYEDLYFSSAGHYGITIKDCTFTLTNGAIGIALSGSQGGRIENNRFYNDATSIAIAPVVTSTNLEKVPMVYFISDNFMSGGIGFKPIGDIVGSEAHEGFRFTNNEFFASTFTCLTGNNLRLIGNDFVSSYPVLGGFNTQIIGNYFDSLPNTTTPLLQLSTEKSWCRDWIITDNNFQGGATVDRVILRIGSDTTGDAAFQITHISLSGNHYVGGSTSYCTGIDVNSASQYVQFIFITDEHFDILKTFIDLSTGIDWTTINFLTGQDFTTKLVNFDTNFGANGSPCYINRVDQLNGSATWNAGSLAKDTSESKDITVTGAALGDFVSVSMSIDVADLTLTAQVTATNTVTCQLSNNTGGVTPIDLGSGTVYVRVNKQ